MLLLPYRSTHAVDTKPWRVPFNHVHDMWGSPVNEAGVSTVDRVGESNTSAWVDASQFYARNIEVASLDWTECSIP